MAETGSDEMLRFLIEVFNAAARQEQGLSPDASRSSMRETGAGRYLRLLAEQLVLDEEEPRRDALIDMIEAPEVFDAEEEAIWLRFRADEADGD